jgi:hypothetical protein
VGEYFEVTLFLQKDIAEKENAREKALSLLVLNEGRHCPGQHRYPLFSNREVLFDVFEETDFLEYRICLSDYVIMQASFDERLTELLQVVDLCFGRIESALFATGIYELTHYYIEEATCIKDFGQERFLKFPLLFFRVGNEYGLEPTGRYGNIAYVVNLGGDVQDIFADHS